MPGYVKESLLENQIIASVEKNKKIYSIFYMHVYICCILCIHIYVDIFLMICKLSIFHFILFGLVNKIDQYDVGHQAQCKAFAACSLPFHSGPVPTPPGGLYSALLHVTPV